MPDAISIKERIERVIVTRVETVTAIGTVYRESEEPLNMANTDALVITDDETAEETGISGYTDKRMPFAVLVCLRTSEISGTANATLRNRMLARVEDAIMGSPQMTEGGTVRLAIDTRCTGTRAFELSGDGRMEVYAAVEFEVWYRHVRDDPYVGPGIEQTTE